MTPSAISVVVPAHNEESTIGTLLAALTVGALPGEISVVVACNGCTDTTADIARGAGPLVSVLELPNPSKRAAQQAGDAVCEGYPRAYIDADVLITLADLRVMAHRIRTEGALAAAPTRRLDGSDCSWVVTSYSRVWERLPQVAAGLFGRGVVMVSEEGAHRVLDLPGILSDDLAMSDAFAPDERIIVDQASVVVRLPRTVRGLMHRRVRVVTGNVQADQLELRRPGSATSVSSLLHTLRQHPRLVPDLPVFVAVTVASRLLARRAVKAGDFSTWQRDDSSR